MNRNVIFIAIISLLSLLAVGCSDDRKAFPPFGWTPTGEPSDSLLTQMSRAMLNYAPADSLDSMVNRYCDLSENEDHTGQYEHRRLYWKGNALFMSGDFEKGDSLRRLALAKCDSTLFPHDFRVYRLAVEQPSDFADNSARYKRYKSDLDFFTKSEDYGSGFSRAVMLMSLMSEAGMHAEALKYALKADSLLTRADLRVLRENNRINIASAYFATGDTLKATGLLDSLRTSNHSYSIPSIAAIIDYNLHEMTGDTAALERAWSVVTRHDELEKMRAFVAAAIINCGEVPTQELKSAQDLSSVYEYTPQERLEISEAFLNVACRADNFATLRTAAGKYKQEVRNYLDQLHKGDIIAAETADMIRDVEQKENSSRERLRLQIFLITVIAIILLSIAAICLTRYVGRLKRNSILQQLEHERLTREHMAKDLLIIEKQQLNDRLQTKIEEMVNKREMENKTAEMIKDIIGETRVENAMGPDENEFMKIFIERYPDVGKTGRKLALYLRKGLDSAQIAQEMNIRKESVTQARWRLRNQMGLTPDTDLDIIIRKI